MNEQNIFTAQDTFKAIEERRQVRAAYSNSLKQKADFEQLTQRINTSGNMVTSPLQQNFTRGATPPEEVAAVIPILEQQIAQSIQIDHSIQGHLQAIEKIKTDARNLQYTLIGIVAIVAIILLFLVLHAVHVF